MATDTRTLPTNAGKYIIADFEDTFNTERAQADKRPFIFGYATDGLAGERGLVEDQTNTGDQNPKKMLKGRDDAGGSQTINLSKHNSGPILYAAMGTPVNYVSSIDSVPNTGGDVNAGGTVTIAGSGAATFSTTQSAAVGSLVYYKAADSLDYYAAFITASASGTSKTLQTLPQGGGDPATITGATVVSIVPNVVDDSSADAVSISDGVVTFDETQASAATGSWIMFEDDSSNVKWARLTSNAGGSTYNAVDAYGIKPPDVSSNALHGIFNSAVFEHVHHIHKNEDPPSMRMQKVLANANPPQHETVGGVRVTGFSIPFAGEGPIVATINETAAGSTHGHQPYDRASLLSGTPTISKSGANQLTFSTEQASIEVGTRIVFRADDGLNYARTVSAIDTADTVFDVSGDTVPATAAGSEVLAAYYPGDEYATAGNIDYDKFNANKSTLQLAESSGTYVSETLHETLTLGFESNPLTDIYTVGNDGQRTAIPGLMRATSLEMDGLFLADRILNFGVDETEIKAKITVTDSINTAHKLEFEFPEAQLPVASPAGDDKITYSVTLQGHKQDSDSSLIATLSTDRGQSFVS
jgi:hypothetical protein